MSDTMITLVECPKCPSMDLPAYAERHAAIHARRERDFAEAKRINDLCNAAYGPRKR